MTDVISSEPANPAPEHVIDPFAHYDEGDEPTVFLVTVAGSCHAEAVAGMSHTAPVRRSYHDPTSSPS